MWDKSLLLLIGAVALVAGQSNQYLPPKDAPKQDKNYLPPDEAPSQPDNQYLPSLEGEANQGVPSVRFPDQQEEQHHEEHDHHHEHWDLRESIPGEPGQDYPLHHAPPDTGFSCVGRTTGYYADIASGCQSFHVCSGDEFPPQSFLCPNGTIFNQKVFACEWWTDVDCKTSEEHYAKNSEIGVVPESNNVQRKPVKQGSGLLSRPIVVAEPNNDINFQPDSSNDDGTLAYLPPKTETRKPVVPEYNGPPPTTAPKRRPPVRAQTEAPAYLPPREQNVVVTISPTLPPGLVVAKYNNRPAPVLRPRTTEAPVQTTPTPIRTTQPPQRPTLVVQAENAYLPPLETVTTQRPVVVRTQAPYRPPVQPKRPVVQEYLPPVTTARPTTQQVVTTQRTTPFQVKQAFNQQNTFTKTQQNNGYNYQNQISQQTTTERPTTQRITQKPTTQRLTTQRPTQAPVTFAPITQRIVSQQANFNSFNQIKQQQFSQKDGYNYERPNIPFPAPTSAPVTQRPTTQRVTTQAPVTVRQTFAPVTQKVIQQSYINQQSFNQQSGYEYQKPVTAAPTTQRVTQAPVTYTTARQTFAPVTQHQQQTFNQNQFTQIKQQSFSQQNGYNYQKPSTQFIPVTAAPTTQRVTQAPVTYTTARQTFAPVTQRQQQAFNQNSFSQTNQQNGYNYQKPSTQFVQPTTAPTTQRATQAPVTYTTARQTFAPVTQRQQQTFNQNQFTQIKQQSFSQQNGYNYEKPAVAFPGPTTLRPTQAPTTYTTAKQTFAPVTQRQQQTFNQNSFSQINQQTFSQQNGYNYVKPSTQFVPVTAAPTTQRVTQAPVTYTTARQTFAPVTQRQQQAFNQNSFSQINQQNGYSYQKPSTQFVQPTAAPTTQRATQAPVTYTTARQTFAPVTQRQQQTFNQNQFTQIKQQSFSQQNGYNYEKPSVPFPGPTTQRPTQAPITYTTAKQTFAPVTQRQQLFNQNTFTQVKQSNNQQNGYNYQKPVTAAPVTQRTTQAPTTQRATQAPFTFTTAKQTSAPVTQRVQSNQNSFTQVQQQVFSQQSGYQYQKPAIVNREQTTSRPFIQTVIQTIAPVVQKQTPVRQSVTQVRQQQTFGQTINSGFSQTKQQSFGQTAGYTYEKPTVTFATQKTEAPSTQRPVTLAPVTYTTVKQTFAPITQSGPSANSYSQTINQNTGYTYEKQTTLPQQTFSQTDGYSYQTPAVSFNTGSNSLGINLAQTVSQSFKKVDEQAQNLDQAHIRINSLSQSQTQATKTKVAEEVPVVLNLGSGFTSHSKTTSGSASSDGYSYSAFSNVAGGAQQISGVQQKVEGTLPPCQHASQPDPLDEIRSPVSFGPPAPFVPKASSTDEGYHYPKPSIPFITPNNPTLKEAQQGTQFGNQGLYTEVSYGGQQQQVNSHHESFIQAFNSASSSNTHGFNSGSVISQQQQQGRSSESLNHEFEIVPSISFSYQLNQKKRSVDQNAAPVA